MGNHRHRHAISLGRHICFLMATQRHATSARDSSASTRIPTAHGHSGVFTATLPACPPARSAFSDDGINFRKAARSFILRESEHRPTRWAAAALRRLRIGRHLAVRPHRRLAPSIRHFRQRRHRSAQQLECQCYFAWRGRHYVLGSFSGFFVGDVILGPYRDLAAEGTISTTARRPWSQHSPATAASWRLARRQWLGGHMVPRTAACLNGNLGMKWPPKPHPTRHRRGRAGISLSGRAIPFQP